MTSLPAPALPPSAHHPLLRRVAGAELAGSQLDWPTEPLDAAAWSSLTRGVGLQRLWGLLGAAVETGCLPVTAEQAVSARDLAVRGMQQSVLLERELVDTLDLLDSLGVEHRVLKGVGTASLDYPAPELRNFADVDVLVRAEAFDQAVAGLSAAGLRRRFPEPRPGFDRRFSKGTSFSSPRGYEIDLHRTFVMGPFGLSVVLDDLWDSGTPFTVGGREAVALGDEGRFLHACYHAALGDVEPRLVPLRDVVQLLLGPALDVARVRQLASRWRAEPVVAAAVSAAWQTFDMADVVALSAWAARYAPDDRARRQLALYHDATSGYAEKSLSAVAAVPGMLGKARFATALAFPQPDYLQGRDRGPRRVRRVLRAVRRVRGLT